MTSGSLSVVHSMPGRVRFRIPVGARADALSEAVTAVEGVVSCAWSPRTRGLLVRYDPEVTSEDAITDAVARHVDASEIVTVMPAPQQLAQTTPTLAGAMTVIAGEVDARVRRVSGGFLTLSSVFPIALALWAMRELVRGTAAPLAWSSALWYAHGLFRDYALPPGER